MLFFARTLGHGRYILDIRGLIPYKCLVVKFYLKALLRTHLCYQQIFGGAIFKKVHSHKSNLGPCVVDEAQPGSLILKGLNMGMDDVSGKKRIS